MKLTIINFINRAIQLPGANMAFAQGTCTCILDDRLQIGLITQQQAKSMLSNGDVAPRQVSCFYDGARAFFEKAVDSASRTCLLIMSS